jgi:hypothetical protein
MMYFKNNWNAGPFFYFMDILEEKKTTYNDIVYIYIYIDFQICMNIYIRLLIFIYSNIQPINITGNFAFILIESETNRK